MLQPEAWIPADFDLLGGDLTWAQQMAKKKAMEMYGKQMTVRRNGKFVLCLHEFGSDTRLNTSWTWSKFVRSFFKAGFSVILVDLPGSGTSYVNQKTHSSSDYWKKEGMHTVSNLLDELKVNKCCTVSYGRVCSTIMQLFERSADQLAGEHIFLNPIVEVDEVFGSMDTLFRGKGLTYYDAHLAMVRKRFCNYLRRNRSRVWACFDNRSSSKTSKTRELFERCRGVNTTRQGADGTLTMHPLVSVSKLGDEQFAEAHLSGEHEVSFLFPSKFLKVRFTQYLAVEGPLAHPEVLQSDMADATLEDDDSAQSVCSAWQQRSSPPTPARSSSLPTLRSPQDISSPCTAAANEPTTPRAGVAVQRARARSRTPSKPPRIDQRGLRLCEQEARCRMEAVDAVKIRETMLTKHSRKKEEKILPTPKLDRDLLSEEADILQGSLAYSLATAKYEHEVRQADAAKRKWYDDAQKALGQQGAIPRGVLHWMNVYERGNAFAADKNRLKL
eukprot:TRINITY_DN9930_c0_g1_i1.p1 TRINITY_DN9930_c0_g1~~TRINITY_DN9930_c0_g1_i1.p1  ORF type:complete len:500 (-),score=110.01 TRINITY_DN9930_c0_g1_i1:83-1582(-)